MSVEVSVTFRCDQCKKRISKSAKMVRRRRASSTYLCGAIVVILDALNPDITIQTDVSAEDIDDPPYENDDEGERRIVCGLPCAENAIREMLPKLIAAANRNRKKEQEESRAR